MRELAGKLPPIDWTEAELKDAPEVHFLTGGKFWDQTIFCAWTLLAHAGTPLKVVLWDDGSLRKKEINAFHRVFPGCCRVVGRTEVEPRLEEFNRKYPTLAQRRRVYPHLRKVTDIHTMGDEWKLVLDSDMLFLRRPDRLLEWLENPSKPLLMCDVETSYGRNLEELESICGKKLEERLNVGVCGLQSRNIDWEEVEKWHAQLIAGDNSSYYDEQALVAMMVADKSPVVLDDSMYICLPDNDEIASPKGILHHYVAGAKLGYFTEAWKVAHKLGLEALK